MKKSTKKAPKKSTLKVENAHQRGLVIWKKALNGKKYDSMPRGFRAEMQARLVKELGCTDSTAGTYVQHYAKHGACTWDYQAQTAPRYKALKTGKAVRAKNGSKVKLVKKAGKGRKEARAAA